MSESKKALEEKGPDENLSKENGEEEGDLEEKPDDNQQEEKTSEEKAEPPPCVDPDTAFDDQIEAFNAEKKALNFINQNSDNILPTKEYIEKTLLKLLLEGLTIISKERPDNPMEFLAYYMLKHNPKRKYIAAEIPNIEPEKEPPKEEIVKEDAKEPEEKKPDEKKVGEKKSEEKK